MEGFNFSTYKPEAEKSKFEQLLDLFMQLLPYTNGDAAETLRWMMELDKQFHLTGILRRDFMFVTLPGIP